MNRQHAYDLGKLVSVWTAWFWTMNWNAVAGFLSAVFTLLLILDKLGLLAPLKAWASKIKNIKPPTLEQLQLLATLKSWADAIAKLFKPRAAAPPKAD